MRPSLVFGIVGAALVGCTATPIPIPYDEFRGPLGEQTPTDRGFWIDMADTGISTTDTFVPPEDGPDTTDVPTFSDGPWPDLLDGPPPDISDAGGDLSPDIPDAGPPEVDAGADAADGAPGAG
jgi:hypothetical protein